MQELQIYSSRSSRDSLQCRRQPTDKRDRAAHKKRDEKSFHCHIANIQIPSIPQPISDHRLNILNVALACAFRTMDDAFITLA